MTTQGPNADKGLKRATGQRAGMGPSVITAVWVWAQRGCWGRWAQARQDEDLASQVVVVLGVECGAGGCTWSGWTVRCSNEAVSLKRSGQ